MEKIKALWGKAVDWCKSAWDKTVVWSTATWVKVQTYPRESVTAAALVLVIAIEMVIIVALLNTPDRKVEQEPTAAAVYPPVYVPPPVATQPTAPVRKTVRVEKAKSNRSPVSQTQSDDVVLTEPEPEVPLPPITPITRESVDLYRASLRKE